MAERQIRRIGLIGVGKHGGRYARHIREEPDLELTAIARRDPGQAAAAEAAFGACVYTDYRELIAGGGVDAIVVVVPPTLHVEIVTAAAHAGLPVLLEKPAVPSLAAAAALVAVLRDHPIPVMVAQTLRFNAVIRALRAACADLGPLHSLTFTQRFEPSPLGWLDDPARSGGGIVLHTGVHAFDLARLLSGLPVDAVTCQMQAVQTRHTEDNFVATLQLGGGAALATVSCARTAGARNGHIELSGERGTVVGDHVLNRGYKVVGTTVEPLALGDVLPTIPEVLRAFIRALRAGAPMPVTLGDGFRAVAVADACYAAARRGEVTAVKAVGEDALRDSL